MATPRLTEKEVREIRARYNSTLKNSRFLAEEYGVRRQTIYHIVHRKSWKHVDEPTTETGKA
jgi:hypothetical protein